MLLKKKEKTKKEWELNVSKVLKVLTKVSSIIKIYFHNL